MILNISIIKTLYYSIKFKMAIFVGRNVAIKLSRNSNIISIPGARLSIGLGYYSTRKALLHIGNNGTLRINGSVSIKKGAHISIQNNATLEIGDQTFVNEDSKVLIYNSCFIGSQTAISYEVLITDSDVHSFHHSSPNGNVYVGNRVWVGARSTLLKKTNIDDNSVVAAGSVVNRTFPQSVLIAGNPAQIKKYDIIWEK